MIKTLKIFVLILVILFTACKSAKRVTDSGTLDTRISIKELIKSHKKQDFKFTTLQSKVKVEYTQGTKSQSHTVNLRMEKDKTIWISASFAVVRAKITPERVSFYNKLDNTYFDGDFSLISDLLGTELNFENIQNLLLGQALFGLSKKDFEADVYEKSYLLKPHDQNILFEIFYLLNPSHFLMDSQQLAQPLERRMLQIDYNNYQEVDNKILPQKIRVIAVEDTEETIINMELKSVSLNNDLRFPFRIPSGFKEIEVE
ncbi:MAG: DUF4292 domain-containing protein [Flavobacteriaceae bacterium]|nr:DUF4292 domain-containing protein [Flavobacteriaceae bacterium]